jgi:endonuclease/exonuclease/phosphatase family metal-dependent hydrolase
MGLKLGQLIFTGKSNKIHGGRLIDKIFTKIIIKVIHNQCHILGMILQSKRLLIQFFFLLLLSCQSSTLSICSWNLKDFGNSKSEVEIAFVAYTIKDFDIVAIQEVVAGEGGVNALKRLHRELINEDKAWLYSVSEPTSSSAYKTERYAFFWKSDKVDLSGNAWLEEIYNQEIDREPYFATFQVNRKSFTLVNFHAITKARQPETEIKYFKYFPEDYPALKLIFCGDFNLPQSHSVFNPLKALGYLPVLTGQKTSLRDRCLRDGCLASEFDNIFFEVANVELLDKGVIHFYEEFNNLSDARKISDHIPIFARFRIK